MKQPGQDSDWARKTILLADDDRDDRDLFAEAMTLVDPAIALIMASDGEELMDLLVKENIRPDLIFLDLNMPRKNGKECLAEIEMHAELSKIPVVIYSTSLNPVDLDETYHMGAESFFRKPNSFEELKQLLQGFFASEVTVARRSRENFLLNLSTQRIESK